MYVTYQEIKIKGFKAETEGYFKFSGTTSGWIRSQPYLTRSPLIGYVPKSYSYVKSSGAINDSYDVMTNSPSNVILTLNYGFAI